MTVPFPDHVALLTALLERHQAIVEQIEARLLNVQGKDLSRSRDRERLEGILGGCVYDSRALPPDLYRLKGQLAAARLADGFEPAALEEAADAFDPVGLIARAYQRWDRQRWPGRHGRLAYARMLYAVFILRQLEALTLRIWDQDVAGAGARLDAIQLLLNRLNEVSAPNILMRDARWLVHTAQGPLTRHLAPYFAVADRIAERFGGPSGLEIHKAGAKLTGGHLRSQLRHRSAEMSRPIDDPGVLAIARNSNSMDAALLVRDLVVLLDAYEAACHAGHAGQRLDLADAILQGVSADPELLLTRLDLLAPCTMIEGLFIARDGAAPSCSPMGASHLALLGRYRERLGRAAQALREDAAALEPSRRPYSPLAMVYGFCADILSNMALGTGTSAGLDLGLEDLFDSHGRLEDKLARVQEWAAVPARDGERERFEYSAAWAEEMQRRTTTALDSRAARPTEANASGRTPARLFVVPRDRTVESGPDLSAVALAKVEGPHLQTLKSLLPAGIVTANEHCVTSDVNRALSSGTTAFPRSQILIDRNEGRFLASAEIDGKWFGVSKTVLTELLGRGHDALVTDVPRAVIDILTVTCADLIVVA